MNNYHFLLLGSDPTKPNFKGKNKEEEVKDKGVEDTSDEEDDDVTDCIPMKIKLPQAPNDSDDPDHSEDPDDPDDSEYQQEEEEEESEPSHFNFKPVVI